ncbi:MAG: carboxylating nicotinate-nucleotide diphosphorylase [Verrucomicrobiae bacterium]|nr:carboxylating nicotinate-nucleotide diphosphorylase [Verrucomicrobiae bacterium]
MAEPSEESVRRAVRVALAEDVGGGDVTTLACIPPEARARAVMRAREPMVLCGLAFAEVAFHEMSPNLVFERSATDGAALKPGAAVLTVSGESRAILTAERVALNFVQRLSGVATLTAAYVEAVRGTPARILDTRKTTPGWRSFEKYAVTCGGGLNHRMGLFDRVLIKDNHLAALAGAGGDPVVVAVERARRLWPGLRVEVEADTLAQVDRILAAGADGVLLDNMSPDQLRAAVALVAGRIQTEASGGMRLETVAAVAAAGVDFISVGAITHSARAVDLGLDFES